MTTYPTSTERINAWADIIEAHPERWDQEWWAQGDDVDDVISDDARLWQAHGAPECGTTCCNAGGFVALTPADVDLPEDWQEAGAVAGGLEQDLARAIFGGEYSPADMPGVLRLIAGLPEGGRTLRAAIDAGLRDLTGADLARADLARANLYGAYLTGADLTGAWRAPTDPAIPGWTVNANNRLERA